MPPPERHLLRHQGVSVGPLSRAEMLEQLQSGRLSLAHLVDVRGKWVTLRQHLRDGASVAESTGARRASAGPASRATDPEIPPPPPGPGALSPLESTIRSGYLWCGLTFGLPFVVLVGPWFARGKMGMGPALEALLLSAAALACTGYAFARAWAVSRQVESDGLEDVARSLRSLAAGLSAASALFWAWAIWLAS